MKILFIIALMIFTYLVDLTDMRWLAFILAMWLFVILCLYPDFVENYSTTDCGDSIKILESATVIYNEVDLNNIIIEQKNKHFVIVINNMSESDPHSFVNKYSILAHCMYLNLKKYEEIMIEYGAKSKIFHHKFLRFYNLLAFDSQENAQRFIDEYIVTNLMLRKLKGK